MNRCRSPSDPKAFEEPAACGSPPVTVWIRRPAWSPSPSGASARRLVRRPDRSLLHPALRVTVRTEVRSVTVCVRRARSPRRTRGPARSPSASRLFQRPSGPEGPSGRLPRLAASGRPLQTRKPGVTTEHVRRARTPCRPEGLLGCWSCRVTSRTRRSVLVARRALSAAASLSGPKTSEEAGARGLRPVALESEDPRVTIRVRRVRSPRHPEGQPGRRPPRTASTTARTRKSVWPPLRLDASGRHERTRRSNHDYRTTSNVLGSPG